MPTEPTKPTAPSHRISPNDLTPEQRARYEKIKAKAKSDLELGLEGPPVDVDMTDAAPF